ncbi:uncharacterized protein J4E79_001938 [Alternaria viburni]|uniref:uncharacterized protein n=1 Tax=Alternaria viburni TaxID=566460 RepID=UPI0020C5A5DE|nr:uncharacterized protein J4E79_001938 [Alternaria viburni]KAI4667253.1 hypothetical protein J4E79_001938 [Alternaria viburni]
MAQESVLLTGATGNVGAITLEYLIRANHKVNIVIRKTSAIAFFESKFADAVQSGLLTFTVIPDMTVAGAFDGPSSSATAVVHVATPLAGPGGDLVKEMIEPTWTIDKNILEAAKTSKTVKRVVICGSIVQTVLLPDFFNPNVVISEKNFNPITFEEAKNDPLSAYVFAKTDAEHKTWSWVETNRPDYDVVMLLPPLIAGRSPQPGYKPIANGPGGNSAVYTALLAGDDVQGVDSILPFVLNTDDVAKSHVTALDRNKVPGNERYLLVSPEIMDLRAIAVDLRAESLELTKRIPALQPNLERRGPEKFAKIDTSKSEAVFGTQWKSGHDTIKEVVLDVVKWEKENNVN